MGVVGSVAWIIPLQLGAYCGYLSFGFIADRVGRRRTFILFMIAAAILVPAYGQLARNPTLLMILGPILGFVGHGYLAMFGGLVAELFPTDIRGTGQGTAYNLGRMSGALAPYVIGLLATIPGVGIGLALASTSAFFLAAALLIFTLPDRSGQELDA
jgi:MFS family permease